MVFNTCAVRENADNKLYGNLSHLAPRKQGDPDMQIAVGGCLAQKDRDAVLRKAPWVDVVFGTHNIGSLPTLLDRARHNKRAQVEIVEALEEFPSALPAARESAYAAWVSISVGCNNTCTFCIVPVAARQGGRPQPRRHPGRGAVAGRPGRPRGHAAGPERQRLRGVVRRPARSRATAAPSPTLLRACGRIDGLERVRFTSPHPAEFTDDVIEAMAETPNVCPALHMPLQSGSDRILRAMRRSYRAERYLGIIDRVRAAMPHAAITTDLIVGFPGETEEDFAGHAGCGARRPGSPARSPSSTPSAPARRPPNWPDQLPKAVVQERYDRLIALQERDLAGGEPRPDRPHRRTAGRHGRRSQGQPAPRG